VSNVYTEYAALAVEIRDEEEAIKEKKRKLSQLEEVVYRKMQDDDIQSVKTGAGTVYRSSRWWAKKDDGVSSEDVYLALIDSGLADLANRTYNTNSLSAYLRELKESGESIPAPLSQVIKLEEQVGVNVRRS
jgi:hypothetical protein